MKRAFFALLFLVPSLGCRAAGGSTATANQAAAAAILTSVAAASSIANRAMGGCYAACQAGTMCNTETGMCTPLPCRARCKPSERCDLATDKCVASGGIADIATKLDERLPDPRPLSTDPCDISSPNRRLPWFGWPTQCDRQ